MLSRAPLRVLLIAEESAGLQVLKLLASSPHELVGLLAAPTPTSRAVTVWNAARKLGVPCWDSTLVRGPGFPQQVADLGVDVLLNVHSLSVLPGEVINACRIGAWNLHPGPLPHYAGINVPSWAIYHGETQHAVTVHRMTSKIDAGTISYEASMSIDPDETGFSLMSKCVRLGVPLIAQLLDAAGHNPDLIPARVQDLSLRRYFNRSPPNAGQIDWECSAQQVVNHVRASDYSPFPSPWGTPEACLNGRLLGILKAERTGIPSTGLCGVTVGDTTDRGVLVSARDEWVLVRRVLCDGVKTNAADVLGDSGVPGAVVAVGA
jgi:methionyl-tRNA formyltransferase